MLLLQKIFHEEDRKQDAVRFQKTQMKKEQIFQKLREQGCRITKQRRMLLDVILEEDCSCCKEIYYKASMKDPGIGTATVYRMVNVLEEIGAISRKNMYRISYDEEEIQSRNQSCRVELSDHTSRSLSSGVWLDVIRAGLKDYGYIEDQDVENVVLMPCE